MAQPGQLTGPWHLPHSCARGVKMAVVEFDYVVVNRDSQLDETVDTIIAIISAEHHRVAPRRVQL